MKSWAKGSTTPPRAVRATTHLTNLLRHLAGLDSDDRFLVIAPGPTLERLADVLRNPRFEAEVYPHPPV